VTINSSGCGVELQAFPPTHRASCTLDTRHATIDEKHRFCRLEYVIRRISFAHPHGENRVRRSSKVAMVVRIVNNHRIFR
jgi:hypothetical protein